MTGVVRLAVGSAAALAVASWFGYGAHSSLYAQPREAIQSQIDAAQGEVEKFERALAGRVAQERRLRSYVDRTLGGDRETVDHRLRTRLNRIAEELQLKGATVGTGRATSLDSPARVAFRRYRELRDEVDFVELAAWISAEGTLEQALELVHRVQSEPWLKRIDQTALNPKDNGSRVEVTVRLTTLFLPGHDPGEIELAAGDPGGFERYASLVQVNPFRVPEAPVVAMPAASIAPPTPPSFAYGQWQLTGLAQGSSGWEAWLRNGTSGELKRLEPGQKLSEAVFVGARAGQAVFRIGDEQFGVALGGRLDDRSPVDQ